MRLGGCAMLSVCSACVSQLMVSCRDVWKPVAKETASSSFAWEGVRVQHVRTKSNSSSVKVKQQHGQVLLGLGGSGPPLLPPASQQHGLPLVQHPVVLVRPLGQLVLELLRRRGPQVLLQLLSGGLRQPACRLGGGELAVRPPQPLEELLQLAVETFRLRSTEEDGGGQRRTEEDRGGQRRTEEDRGGRRRIEEDRGGQRGPGVSSTNTPSQPRFRWSSWSLRWVASSPGDDSSSSAPAPFTFSTVA
ncbi:hypothetical protein EYF80_039010 [Liparis tanakae]|uniref:Secreted protein n=1 Tax=Liparis tanakae TaxID=230148 RepID=A0A4Z2GB27_9TELE|nr:hypothetical protein EYF80_039010 [Liparis tanakae]